MRANWRLALIGMIGGLTTIGCERAKVAERHSPTTAPTVAIVPPIPPILTPATLPATDPATTEPATAFMMIDQRRIDFPTAKLRVQKVDGRVLASLYSDDPKDALDDKYRGNGFYFEMPLDVPEVTFEEAAWFHHSETAARVETPYGIFLNGHRIQLQPLETRARFLPGVNGLMKVELSGTFLAVDTQDDSVATRTVPVAAWLLADPVAPKK